MEGTPNKNLLAARARFNEMLRSLSKEKNSEYDDLFEYLAIQSPEPSHRVVPTDEMQKTATIKKKTKAKARESSAKKEAEQCGFKRLKQLSLSDCGICLCPLRSPSARLECSHKFCQQCLKPWLQQSSSCPLCRSNCRVMFVGSEAIAVQAKRLQAEPHYGTCYVCRRDENDDAVLICDACDMRVCHYYCDGGLDRMPAANENWYCHECSDRTIIEEEIANHSDYEYDGFVVPDSDGESFTEYQ